MIRGITVLRANVVPGVCDPVQWSQNSQLAINNGQSLTVLEPVLPAIHQSIIPPSKHTKHPVLDAASLFHVNTAVQAETLASWGLRKFANIEVTLYDEKSAFGKFTDLTIVSHKWSPPLLFSKRCDLAILLNSCEMLVLERPTIDADRYDVKLNVFDKLLEHHKICAGDNGVLLVSNAQLEGLKVVCFEYSACRVSPLLAIATANNVITIFDGNMEATRGQAVLPEPIVKMVWSPQNADGSSYIAVVTASSALYTVRTTDVLATLVKPSSRFLVSLISWKGPILLLASTCFLHAYSMGSKKSASLRLGHYSLVTGIVSHAHNKETLRVLLAHEDGLFELSTLHLSKFELEHGEPNGHLEKLVRDGLYKYQLSNSAIGGSSTNHNYLNDVVEGEFVNYGTKLNGQIVCVVSRIFPKDVINYTILSKIEYQIAFVPQSVLDGDTSPIDCVSPLSWIHLYWFNHYQEIPQISQINEQTALEFKENTQTFIESLDLDSALAEVKVDLSAPLKQQIIDNFIQDETVFRLQVKLNLIKIILNTLRLLQDLTKTAELDSFIAAYEAQFSLTTDGIFARLSRIVCQVSTALLVDPVDHFIYASYHQLSGSAGGVSGSADQPIITVKTPYLTESFAPNGDKDTVESATGHTWRRCNLTLLPLLQINHKTSEVGGFDYLIPDTDSAQSWLATDLLTHLDFCVFTGNRTFKRT